MHPSMSPHRRDHSPGVPRLRTNVALLGGAKLAASVVPLITTPYLARVLEPDTYGRTGFATAVVAYAVIVTDYGFNYSATNEIARNQSDLVRVRTVVTNTLCAKAALAGLAAAALLVAVAVSSRLADDSTLLWVAFVQVIGTVVTPVWLYQGMERMAWLAGVTVVARLASIPATFALVDSPGDGAAALAVAGVPAVGAGIWLLVEARRREWFHLGDRPSRTGLARAYSGSGHMFVSSAAVALYTTTNTVIVGFRAPALALAAFVAAERLVRALLDLMSPVPQVLYPRLSRLMTSDRPGAVVLLRHAFWVQTALAGMSALGLFALAGPLVRVVYGADYEGAVGPLRILAFVPLAVAWSNIVGVQILLPLGRTRAVMRILVCAGLVNVPLVFILASRYEAVGAASALLCTETLVMALFWSYARRTGCLPLPLEVAT